MRANEGKNACLLFVHNEGLISIGFLMEEDGIVVMMMNIRFLLEENGVTFMVELHQKELGKLKFWGLKGVENEPKLLTLL
jgi:hypothetical protein